MKSRLGFASLMLLLGGCSYFMPNPPCPPPPSARTTNTLSYSCDSLTVDPVLPDPCSHFVLADLVDLALQNSPATRTAWYNAKAAATDVGVARGAYLPPLTLHAQYFRLRFLTVDAGFEAAIQQENIGPTISTTYLLFDFGGRNANLEAATYALDAYNWIYNWEAQSVIIRVAQNYYNYVNALALVEADRETVKDDQQTVEATEARVRVGVGNLSDELQAKTQLLSSQITLEQDLGMLKVMEANLLQSLGLVPDTPIAIAPLPDTIETQGVCQDMDYLFEVAKANRADLKAQRANILEKKARIEIARSDFLPKLNSEFRGGREWLNKLGPANIYDVHFNLEIPVFSQFADINAIRRAQAELLAAQSNLDQEELDAFLEVATDYYEFQANTKILNYSEKYLEYATKNRRVAFANYKMGITTIIDLMTANNQLNAARRQLADAKTNWLASLANLAYDTGGLACYDINTEEQVIPRLIEEECE